MHSAFGISLVSDQLGLTNTINPLLTYAYRIKLRSDWSVSMGLSAGVFSRSVDGSLFEPGIQADPALYNNLATTMLPDANAGIEFQSPHLIAGLASTHLLSIGNTDNPFLNSTHYYGYFIYKNTESEMLNYNAGLQIVKGPVITVLEGNASVRFKKGTGLSSGPKEIFDIGMSYRTSNQLILLLGLNVTSNLRIGYAYDQSFSVGFSRNSTHEIMLEYRIPSKAASSCNCNNESFWYY
jgi:type IX secretion system PorP/SprF family membrane protein